MHTMQFSFFVQQLTNNRFGEYFYGYMEFDFSLDKFPNNYQIFIHFCQYFIIIMQNWENFCRHYTKLFQSIYRMCHVLD